MLASLHIIDKKILSLKIFESYFFFIVIDFDLDNLKLLILFGNLSFLPFNINSANDIDLEELYNSSSS